MARHYTTREVTTDSKGRRTKGKRQMVAGNETCTFDSDDVKSASKSKCPIANGEEFEVYLDDPEDTFAIPEHLPNTEFYAEVSCQECKGTHQIKLGQCDNEHNEGHANSISLEDLMQQFKPVSTTIVFEDADRFRIEDIDQLRRDAATLSKREKSGLAKAKELEEMKQRWQRFHLREAHESTKPVVTDRCAEEIKRDLARCNEQLHECQDNRMRRQAELSQKNKQPRRRPSVRFADEEELAMMSGGLGDGDGPKPLTREQVW